MLYLTVGHLKLERATHVNNYFLPISCFVFMRGNIEH